MTRSRTIINAERGLLGGRLALLWHREPDQTVAGHGLTAATTLPLMPLSCGQKCTRQDALAEVMGIKGSSLGRLIDLLEAEELIDSGEDPVGCRPKMLHLTLLCKAGISEINRVLLHVSGSLLKEVQSNDLVTTFEARLSIRGRANRLCELPAILEA